jgi:hypothetical protein
VTQPPKAKISGIFRGYNVHEDLPNIESHDGNTM